MSHTSDLYIIINLYGFCNSFFIKKSIIVFCNNLFIICTSNVLDFIIFLLYHLFVSLIERERRVYMKKSLSIIFCIVMVATTFCSCKIIKNKDVAEEGLTYIDASGVTHEYATNEFGEVVTNKDGEKETTAAGQKSADKKSEKAADKNGKGDNKDGKDSTDVNNQTFVVTDKNGKDVTDKNGNSVTTKIDESILTSTQKTDGSADKALPEGQKISNTTLAKTKVEPVLKGGTFTIKGKMSVEGMQLPVTIAFRNKKDFSMEMSYSVLSVRMFSNGGKYYMALPTMKKYTQTTSDMIDLEELGDPTKAFNPDGTTYQKTTSVKDGKVTYTCEQYKTKEGAIIKYFFDSKGDWKRMELKEDGETVIWKIDSFSNKADDKLFNVDKSWKRDDKFFEGMF